VAFLPQKYQFLQKINRNILFAKTCEKMAENSEDSVDQGCQMVCFQTENLYSGKFWRALDWKMLINFMPVLNILETFGIFFNHLVHFVFIWNILCSFGTFGVHLVHLVFIWYIWCSFGTFGVHLVHLVFIWYIFSGFGIMYEEKSGNLWQAIFFHSFFSPSLFRASNFPPTTSFQISSDP
jgi:hypothetical protein